MSVLPDIFGNASVMWVAAMVIFLVVEAITAGLAVIWFAIGSLGALIASFFGAPLWLQIVCFLVLSVASLILTRPLVKKYVNTKTIPTNADMLIGKDALVVENIDNGVESGAVRVDGKVWTARSATDETHIVKGERVKVIRIEGVKLIVS